MNGWHQYGSHKAHFFNQGYPICGNAFVRTNLFRALTKQHTGPRSEKCKSCLKQQTTFEWSHEGIDVEAFGEGLCHCLAGNVKK